MLFAFISTQVSAPLYSNDQALWRQDAAGHRKIREEFGAMSQGPRAGVCTRVRTVVFYSQKNCCHFERQRGCFHMP